MPSVIQAKIKFHLDNLVIHHKSLTVSLVSFKSSEVVEIISIPSTNAGPTTMPGIPTSALAPTSRCLAQLQIILRHQPHLDQLDRYFNSHIEVLQKKVHPLEDARYN